ncbi:MAG: DUF2914 domain-containing protein [Elusimicrobia bacterium]|nr:DUF2914 domain-containing protein [Elusimicrobiota bacterium]
MKKILWAVGLVVGGLSFVRAEEMAPVAAPAPAGVEILGASVGTGVDNRELTGESATFDAGVTRVYCWTKAKAATVPGSLKHVWSVDGKEVSEVPLTLSVSPARTWSYKTVWPGAWKVEVKDDAGTVLKSIDFTVAAAAAASPAAPQ